MNRQHLSAQASVAAGLLFLAAPALRASTFVQTNLTSDISGLAANTDPNLKNPWGMSFSPTSPFWVSDQAAGVATLYTGTGSQVILGTAPNQFSAVSIPPGTPVPNGPTGQVFNSTAAFIEANGVKANFIFDTLAGTIDAWNPGDGSTAEIMHSAAGATYTGLALDPTSNRLYAANFGAGRIDVYDSTFAPATTSGGFADPGALAGYSPYNIAMVGGNLFVQYDQVNPTTHRPQPGAGLGYVDVFDTNGNLIRRFATGGALDAPWGITMAPAGFGSFGGDILIGNFGNGEINAYTTSGAFDGTLMDASGHPIVNSGLWSIDFRTGGPNVNPNALYFTAGINGEADGLFGSIAATPEPGTLGAVALAAGLLLLRRRR